MPDKLIKNLGTNTEDKAPEKYLQEFQDWKIIIVSNRGPIENVVGQDGDVVQQKGSGGLITGLSGAIKFFDATWISCPQTSHDADFGEGFVSLFEKDKDIHIKFIDVDPQTYDDYYNVIANPLIWFLQHSMWNVPSEPVIDHTTWAAWREGYLSVNRLFAEEIIKQINRTERQTLVMLQDYQLYMTAKFIRENSSANSPTTLLHFVHIPWPGPEYWHILPPSMRRAILESLCGVDLLGFQTKKDGLNFIRTIESHLPDASVDYEHMRIWYDNHATYIHDFPISIDVESLKDMVHEETVIEHKNALEEVIGDRQVILRVDRIDPSKNIVRGFQAYQELLTLHPEYQEKVIFLAMLVPSRRGIEEYKDYLDKIMAISGQINADFGNKDWEPVRILVGEGYERALAAMQLYDVLLINPIADGMNLVAKEGPTINTRDGVLILSERAGASLQLAPGSTIISPCDIFATAEAMHQGLSMDAEEKENRAETLRWIIEQYDIHKWFVNQLQAVINLNLKMSQTPKTAILHYSAPPTIGGVEAVISAQASTFLENGLPITIIAGRGKKSALPEGAEFIKIPLLDSQHRTVLEVNKELARGVVSESYRTLREKIKARLEKSLVGIDNLIAHNIFSKHFNLAFTEAMILLLEEGKIPNTIAWCHDFSVQSENDKSDLHQGDPWEILRTHYPAINYVVVSRKRQAILAEILGVQRDKIQVIYNGFDPDELLGTSKETSRLIRNFQLWDVDLIILMPVRITQAKNIEFALQVAAELQSKEQSFCFLLTGPPDPHDQDNMAYFRKLKKMRAELDLEEHFKFLYDENPGSDEPYILDMNVVAELYRVCDMIFMPSHHEGFGMPVLEAGFVGKPVFSTRIPAAEEIGDEEIHEIFLSSRPESTAQQIISWASSDPRHLFRVRTRQNYTWQKIFCDKIQPLLIGN